MTTRARTTDDTSEMGSPITGEVVQLDAVRPSAEEQKADARGRIGNTAVQSGIPGALIVIASWVAALAHWDLDPGAGADIPATVVAALTTVLTVGIAVAMNRSALRAVVDELAQLRDERAYLQSIADEQDGGVELGLVVDIALLVVAAIVVAWALGANLPLNLHL